MVALQSQYAPRSQGSGIDTVTPTNMTTALALSLDRVEQVTGLDIDTYVATKLGIDREALFERYAAEQIDTLAITYLNLERGKVTLIGNDTGTGKGRIVCGLIQSVIAPVELPDLSRASETEKQQALSNVLKLSENATQANQVAVFLTAKPELYVDMLGRDMVDTGIKDRVRPFFTNAALDLELKSPDGATIGFVRTGSTAEQSREMQRLIDEFRKTGKIDRYNVIFTTYDQLKEKGSIRRQFIEAIAPAATFILDECDLGGGASGPRSELTAGQKREQEAGGDIRSTSAFLADVVLPASRNYALLSATAFKDPYVLTRLLYPKSEIQQTGLSVEALAGTLVKQGTPAQQDFTSKLAMAGELVRLEKSMEGIEFAGAPVQVNLDKFEQSIRVMRLIVNFDRAKKSAVEILEEAAYVRAEQVKAVDPSAGEASIHSTLFSSTAYNFAQQLLFALSSEGIANEAIAEIEAGRKPIIGFYNTMQSALEFYLEARYNEIFTGIKATYREQHFDQIRLEHPDVAPEVWEELFDRHYFGQISTDAKREYQAWSAAEPVIDLNVGDLLLRQLEKCRWVTIGDPYGDKRRYRMTDEELGAGAMEIVAQIQHQAETLDWSGIPISPIDDIIQRIRDRGYDVAEMSGRSLGLDYSSGLPRLKTVEARDVQTRTDAKAAFNNGSVDVLITNITTGWSGHASRTFQDQRRRVLIVGQAHPDVNKFVQLLGRGNRTGQLNPAKHAPDQVESGRPTWGRVTERHGIPGDFGLPQCKLVIAEGVPYVQRIVSEMNRKMDSLNANTTGNRTSAQSFDGPSFSNRAGDIVASQLLEDDSELNEALDYPLVNTESNEGAAKKVTGRAIFLPLDQQARLFEALNDRFHAYVAQQEALGESPIEQKTLDLQAQTQARLELVEAQSKSVLFGGSVTVERMLIRALQKPYSTEQIRSEILSRLGLAEIPVQSNDFAAGSTLRQAAIGQIETRLDSEDDRVVQQIEEYKQKINQLATQIEPKAKLLQSKTEIQSEITELSEQAKDQQISEFERKGFEKQISQKQAQFKRIESQLKKLAKYEVSYTNLQSRRHDLETRWASVRDAISKFQPGQSVSIRTSNGAMYGIILNCQRNENVKSPVAGSSWKFSIAVVDSSRELTLAIGDVVSATGFTTIQLQPVEFGVRVDPRTGDISLLSVPEMFDRSQSETHELREMLTGNLLNAKSGGKYVSFTTVEGVVRQGILLPRESDVEKELAAAPVTIANPLQAQQLLNEGAVLGTQDKLKLEQSSQFFEGKHQRGIEVSVSASRRGGGHYYTDVELLKFTRNREGKPGFAKHSDKMKSFVPDENLEAFLRYLIANGRELQVTQTAFKDRAREITGQELKTFTASSGDEQGMAEFRISVEEIRAEIDQHRIRNTDSVEDPIEFDESIDNVELLTLAYQQHFSEGGQFQNIRAARQFGIEQLEQHERSTELLDRTIEECIESGIVRYAKDLAAIEDMNSLDRFDTLVELYHRQPNLSARTSNSILLQQYSTPVPLGLLVQELAHIQTAQTVWEPTAGNGALLTATPSSTRVIANEIDSNRANQLRRQGYEVTERDATEASLSEPVDVVVANPPFGKSNDLTGAPKQWQIDLGQNPAPGTRAYPTTQLDHAIAFKALSVMKDQGRAVLVLGAPMAQKVGANAASAYNGNDKRAFFYTLYQNYNVTQHFTVSGDLYSKQGTSFPVDIIVIEGRGKSQLPLPAAQIPPVYREWAELREIFVQTLEQRKTLEADQFSNAVDDIEAQLPDDQVRSPIRAETASPNQSNADILPTQIEPAPINLLNQQSDPVASIQLRPAREQIQHLEQQAAKFLFDTGIAEAILKDDRFTLGVDRDPYQPLAIQCHDNRLSFTRCRELPDRGFVLDSEAVFQVEPTGHLRFVEVASPLPIGNVLRSPDRAFAMTLIRALHENGFVEATQIAYQRTQPEAIAIRLANSISSLLGRELNTVRSQSIELDGIDYVFESGRLLTSGRRFYDFVSVIDVSGENARPVFSVEDMDNNSIATVFDQSRLKRLRSEVESEDFVVFLPNGFEERFMTIAELTDNVAVHGANRLNIAADVDRDQQGGLNLEAVQFTSEPPALDRLNRFIAGVGENEVVPLTQELTEIERQLTELWSDDCAAVAQSVAAQQPEMDLSPDSYSQALMPILEQIKTLLESANWQPIRAWATPDWISKSDIARQVALAIYVQERDQVFERSRNELRDRLWCDPDLQIQTEALRINDEQNARIEFEQRFSAVFQDWFNADEAQNLRYYRAVANDPIKQRELCNQLFEEWKTQASVRVTPTSLEDAIAALAQRLQTDLADAAPALASVDAQNRRIAFNAQFDQSLLQIRHEHLQLYQRLASDPTYKAEIRNQLFQQWNDAISDCIIPATTLADLQNRYPDYSFDQDSSGLGDRNSSILLFAYDPDGSIAAHINVSQYGKTAYAQVQEQIERHEVIRATPPLPALRAEFPGLRFEREITRVGILVKAFDKVTRERVEIGRVSDEHNNPTPDQLADFITSLRDRGYSTGIVSEASMIVLQDSALEALRQLDSLPFPLNHYLAQKLAAPDAIVLIQDPALGCYVGFGEVASVIADVTGGATRTMEVGAVEIEFSRIPRSKITEVVEQLQRTAEVVVAHSQHDRETFPLIPANQERSHTAPFLSVDNPTLIFEGGSVTFTPENIEAIANCFIEQHQYTQQELRESLAQAIACAVPPHMVEAAVTALIEDDHRLTQSGHSPTQQSEVKASEPTLRVSQVTEADDWNTLVKAQEKSFIRGQKTALDRLDKFESRIKEAQGTLTKDFDRLALKITLQALREATVTPQGQRLLLEFDSKENAKLDGETFAARLVRAATDLRGSFVAQKMNDLEPLLQDLQQRYPDYQFQRSNFSRTEGEDYPHLTILDAVQQRITSLYLVEATPETIEKANLRLRDHQASVAQRADSPGLSTPEHTKVRPAAIEQLQTHLNALQAIVERIESGQNLEPDRPAINQKIALAIAVFDKFRELASTTNIDADLVFTELLGGTQTVSELLASVKAWEQTHSISEVDSVPTGYAIVATEWGDLTGTVTLHDDDCVQVEVIGTTANCYDYPSHEYVSYIGLDEWSAMSPDLHDFDAYARFVAEEQHKQFLHQLGHEANRIAPELNRWLNSKTEGERQAMTTSVPVREEFIQEFLSIYPERDRIDFTLEFRRLAIRAIVAPDALIELTQSDARLTTHQCEEPPQVSEEAQQLTLLELDNQPRIDPAIPSHSPSPAWDCSIPSQSQFGTVQLNEDNPSNQNHQMQAESPLPASERLEASALADENARDQKIEEHHHIVSSEPQLAMAEEIVEIARRYYAYGVSIDKIEPDSTQQTWTFTTKDWDIRFTLPNLFSILGRDEAAMHLATIEGRVGIEQSSHITEADLESFREIARRLDRKNFSSPAMPDQVQLVAQSNWETTQLDRQTVPESNIPAETGEVIQSTLFTVDQFEASLPTDRENHQGSLDPTWVEMEKSSPEPVKTVPASQVAIATLSAINPEAANQLASMLQSSHSSSTIDQLRQWWKQALEIGRPPEHLQKIKEVGVAVKAGTRQPAAEDLSQMQRDQEKWQQVQTLVAQAHRFLNHIGQDEFQKDNYRIQRSSTHLTITDISEGRGDIVRVDGETFRSKVMKKDIERFAAVDKIVQKLQRTPASAAMPSHGSVLAEQSS